MCSLLDLFAARLSGVVTSELSPPEKWDHPHRMLVNCHGEARGLHAGGNRDCGDWESLTHSSSWLTEGAERVYEKSLLLPPPDGDQGRGPLELAGGFADEERLVS